MFSRVIIFKKTQNMTHFCQYNNAGVRGLMSRWHYCPSAPADDLGCWYPVYHQGGSQEAKTGRTGVQKRRHPHDCWHEPGTVKFQRSYRQCLLTLFHPFDIRLCLCFFQKKGYYKAKHNTTGEEGLINSSNVRERHALRVDPNLSLMPYVVRIFWTRRSRITAVGCKHVYQWTMSKQCDCHTFVTCFSNQKNLSCDHEVWVDVWHADKSGLRIHHSNFLFFVCLSWTTVIWTCSPVCEKMSVSRIFGNFVGH